MDSGYKKSDEQEDLPPCKQSRLDDDDELLGIFDKDWFEQFAKFCTDDPLFVDILRTSYRPIMRPASEIRPMSRDTFLRRWKIRAERSTSLDGSDSDESVTSLDDFDLIRQSSSDLRKQRIAARKHSVGLVVPYPPDRSPPSSLETPRYRRKGSESKSGPVCLMGDRVVIQARGPDIDRVCYYPTGMTNPTGTLCYMNSVLQAMGVLPLFAVGVALHSPDLESSLLNALRELYGQVWYPSELDPPMKDSPLLDGRAVRAFLRANSKLFPENLEHDVEELFLYFVDALEREMSILGLGAGNCNPVTRIFSGWTQLPGTAQKEYFYSLRLAVHDNRIHSVKDAFFAHLSANQSLESGERYDEQSETTAASTISTTHLNSKFSVPIDRLNPNTSVAEELNCTENDECSPKLHSSEVQEKGSEPESKEESCSSVLQSPVLPMVIQPPEVLCLCLDRNYIDHDKGSVVYEARPIAIDEEVIIGTAYLPEGTEKPMTYRLRSVISYRYRTWGSGHYVAGTLLKEGVWAMCDDSIVSTAKGPTLSSNGNLSSFMHFYVRVA